MNAAVVLSRQKRDHVTSSKEYPSRNHSIFVVDILRKVWNQKTIQKMRRLCTKNKSLFPSRQWTTAVAVANLVKLGFQLVRHPSHCPDLASSDYYLFSMMKFLTGKDFTQTGMYLPILRNWNDPILFGRDHQTGVTWDEVCQQRMILLLLIKLVYPGLPINLGF